MEAKRHQLCNAHACRPVVYRDLELSYSSQCRVLSYTLPSLALSLILNLPKFMEAKLWFKVSSKSKIIKEIKIGKVFFAVINWPLN